MLSRLLVVVWRLVVVKLLMYSKMLYLRKYTARMMLVITIPAQRGRLSFLPMY